MKSTHFSELLAWQVGVKPTNLAGVDFRRKIEGLPANHKGFTAFDISRQAWSSVVDTKTLLGGDWGLGLLKNRACDFCDDVIAETADVAVGDAWLPEYMQDSRGHSIVVVRQAWIDAVVCEGIESGQIEAVKIDAETVARSQAGGLRHRREGLRWRLSKANRRRVWSPPKRVPPSARGISLRRRRIYYLRERLRDESAAAFIEAKDKDDLSIFYARMRPLISNYRNALKSRRSWKIVQPLLRIIRMWRRKGKEW